MKIKANSFHPFIHITAQSSILIYLVSILFNVDKNVVWYE